MTCNFLITNKKEPCDYYLPTGLCLKPDFFRCTEYMEKFEPILSNSGVKSFIQCPRKYYLGSILGLKVKEQFKSDAIKIGSCVDNYITHPGIDILEGSDIWEVKANAICLAYDKTIKPFPKSIQGQKEFSIKQDGHPTIIGRLDLAGPNFFFELKCTTSPKYYTDKYWIHDQMGTYFLSNSKYEYGILLVIKTPALKQTGTFKNETLEEYRDRCFRDICKRPLEYFVNFKKDKKTFGIKFFRHEFDLEGLRYRYKWVGGHIQQCLKAEWIGEKINNCICEGYWYQDRTRCLSPFTCDFLEICDSGGVSEDVYEYRQ